MRARAHLRPEPAVAAEVGPDERLRLGVGSVLVCWVLFAVAGLALYKTTEALPAAPNRASSGACTLHPGPRALGSWGGARGRPLVLAFARLVRPEPPLALAAFGYVAAFAAATAALVSSPSGGVGAGVRDWAWSVVASSWDRIAASRCRGLASLSPPRPGRCATVVVAAMVGIAVLTVAYLLTAVIAAPAFAGEPNGPLGLVSVATSLAILRGDARPVRPGGARDPPGLAVGTPAMRRGEASFHPLPRGPLHSPRR